MKKIKILFLPVLLAMLSVEAWGQDLHFSQYYNTPLLVNPANTGFNPDFDFRAGVNYRNQWASVGSPYKTTSAWGDVKLLGNRIGQFNRYHWNGIAGVSSDVGLQ